MSQTEVQLIKDAVIVNADVSNSAAIDVSKISGVMPLTGGSFTDDVTFTGASSNIVFDKSDNALEFADNSKAIFGTGSDLEIYHDSSHSYISEIGTGELRITADSAVHIRKHNNENIAKFTANDSVELYHDNSKKFETTSTGATVTGDLLATGLFKTDTAGEGLHNTATNAKFFSNNSNDTHLEHASNNQVKLSFIATGSTYRGAVSADANAMHLLTGASGEQIAVKCVADGTTELRHSGTAKFETTSSGVVVTGDNSNGSFIKGVARFCPSGTTTVKAMWDEGGFSGAGHFQVKDGVAFTAGDSSDLKIFHDGTDDVVHSTGTSLRTRSNLFRANNAADNKVMFRSFSDGAFEAYHNGNKKFETLSDGVNVTGTLKVNNSAASFGKILQVVHTKITNAFTYNSTSMNNVGISASITPSATSSKILVMFNINAGSNNNGNRIVFRVSRTGDDNEFVGDANGSRTRGSAQMAVSNPQDQRGVHISYVSSPSSTSAVTYALQAKLQVGGGSYVVFGGSGTDSNNSIEGRTPQHITLIEIAG